MSAQAVGVLGVGTDPPPDSTLPRWSVVILVVSASIDAALGLGHLADLLRQRHPAEQVGDPLADRQRRVLVRQDVGRCAAAVRGWAEAPLVATVVRPAARAAAPMSATAVDRRVR